jgi:hypothetical protein
LGSNQQEPRKGRRRPCSRHFFLPEQIFPW